MGEQIIGAETGAVAQIIGRLSATEVEVAVLSSTDFILGEVCNFAESNISSTLQEIVIGNNSNITNRFSLDKGQREEFYDFSRIVRKTNFPAPSRKLIIVYDRYDVPSNDKGDFYTVDSYAKERFGKDVPHLKNGLRASDTIDFRPRVEHMMVQDHHFHLSIVYLTIHRIHHSLFHQMKVQ